MQWGRPRAPSGLASRRVIGLDFDMHDPQTNLRAEAGANDCLALYVLHVDCGDRQLGRVFRARSSTGADIRRLSPNDAPDQAPDKPERLAKALEDELPLEPPNKALEVRDPLGLEELAHAGVWPPVEHLTPVGQILAPVRDGALDLLDQPGTVSRVAHRMTIESSTSRP